jgi:mRNA-degrading endonuclease RelE of RelBE toxin-antitoxin system
MVHYHLMMLIPNYKSPFSKFVKKAHKPLQLAIEDAVEEVCENPEVGEAKVGDLAGIWVYKFRFNRQEYLVAYRPPSSEARKQGVGVELLIIDFYQVGLHENFYDELKRYLKSEG